MPQPRTYPSRPHFPGPFPNVAPLLDHLVIIQGVAKILFVGYVVVLGRPMLLSSPVDASLGEVVIVVAMHGVNQASPIVCVRAKVVGGFAAIRAMVPEFAVPTFLGVVAGSSAGVDRGHYTTWLGPLYRFPVWFDSFYNVIYASGHLGPSEVFFNIDPHFGQLPFLLVVLPSFGQDEFFVSFHSSVSPL